MSLLPEIKLKKVIDYYLDLITEDYNNSLPNEQESFLYGVFGENSLDNYDFFTQAKAIILRSSDNPRKLQTRLFFDRTRATIPTVHINLPSESPNSDSLGYGIGNNDPIFNDESYRMTYERCFDSKYNLTVTSDNSFEVLIVYSILKAIIISCVDIMEVNGLRNPKVMGNDLMVNMEQTPPLYMRALGLNFIYEFVVPELKKNSKTTLNEIDFTGTDVESGNEFQHTVVTNS